MSADPKRNGHNYNDDSVPDSFSPPEEFQYKLHMQIDGNFWKTIHGRQ
jgi:hypothetical protein